MLLIAFVDVDPLSADDGTSTLQLFRPRNSVVHTHVTEEGHFNLPALLHGIGIKRCSANIINSILNPVLRIQSAELSHQILLTLAICTISFNVVAIEFVDGVDPMLRPLACRCYDTVVPFPPISTCNNVFAVDLDLDIVERVA